MFMAAMQQNSSGGWKIHAVTPKVVALHFLSASAGLPPRRS